MAKNRKPSNTLDLTHPAIVEDLWEASSFDNAVFSLLEQYIQAKETNRLSDSSPTTKKLTQNIYHHLTTTRNRNLITQAQQAILRGAVGGFFGLSTGSHAAITWTMQSRADVIKIVDPDIISPTNLNRLRTGWDSIGKLKTDVVAQEIAKVSPHTQVISTTQTDAISQENYFKKSPKINFIVEAIDDLESKVRLRLLAKKYRLPYLMATDVGDNVFLDIERYDHNPQPKLFNGRVINIENVDFKHLTPQKRIQLAMQIVGFDHNSEAMLDTLATIGQKVATWPQLAATATIAGGVITTAITKILLKEKITSGRYYISLDDLLVKDFNSPVRKQAKLKLVKKIYERFGAPK